MTEAWGWDDLTGDWLDDVDAPAPADIPAPRDGRLDGPALASADVTGADEQ